MANENETLEQRSDGRQLHLAVFQGRDLKINAPYEKVNEGDILVFSDTSRLLVLRKIDRAMTTLERTPDRAMTALEGNPQIVFRSWDFYRLSSRQEGFPLLYNFQAYTVPPDIFDVNDRVLREAGIE